MNRRKEKKNTCGKQIGIPPRISFGGLKIAYMIKSNVLKSQVSFVGEISLSF